MSHAQIRHEGSPDVGDRLLLVRGPGRAWWSMAPVLGIRPQNVYRAAMRGREAEANGGEYSEGGESFSGSPITVLSGVLAQLGGQL